MSERCQNATFRGGFWTRYVTELPCYYWVQARTWGGGEAGRSCEPPLQFHKGPLFRLLIPTGLFVVYGGKIYSRPANTGLVRSAAPTTRGSWLMCQQLGASEESDEVQARLVRSSRTFKFSCNTNTSKEASPVQQSNLLSLIHVFTACQSLQHQSKTPSVTCSTSQCLDTILWSVYEIMTAAILSRIALHVSYLVACILCLVVCILF